MEHDDKQWVEISDQWRTIALNWMKTAELLAIDLGDIGIAKEVYTDVRDGLYEKVRQRLNS